MGHTMWTQTGKLIDDGLGVKATPPDRSYTSPGHKPELIMLHHITI